MPPEPLTLTIVAVVVVVALTLCTASEKANSTDVDLAAGTFDVTSTPAGMGGTVVSDGTGTLAFIRGKTGVIWTRDAAANRYSIVVEDGDPREGETLEVTPEPGQKGKEAPSAYRWDLLTTTGTKHTSGVLRPCKSLVATLPAKEV